MKPELKIASLHNYKRYALKAQILDDLQLMRWFADVCTGKSPEVKVSQETLALMEGHGLIRKTDFGWVLGAEGRQFARELGIIPGPSRLEIDPSLIKEARYKSEAEQHYGDTTILSSEKVGGTKQELYIDQKWQQFWKTRDEYSRNILMENYIYLVRYCAERVHRKLPNKVDLDDLISAGIFGLMDAIDAFDPSRRVKFETYCMPRIKGSMLDELRSMDWVPRLVRTRSHQLDKASRSLETQLGRKPTAQEIAEELNMDKSEFNRLRRDASTVSLSSLETALEESESEEDIGQTYDLKGDKVEDSSIKAQKEDLKNLLTKGLTRAERLVIVLYYYQDMTMKEIGTILDLSESRVSQMHSSIVARLKAQMKTHRKEDFKIQ